MSLRFRSILGQIVWLHVLVLGMAAAAVLMTSYLLLRSTAVGLENRTLQAHASTIASHLTMKSNGALTLELPADLRTFYSHGFDGLAYSISDEAGRVLFTSLPRTPLWLGTERRTNGTFYFQFSGGHSSYFGVSVPRRFGTKLVWVQVIQDLEHPDVIFDDVVAAFLGRVAWLTVLILAFALAADIYVVRRALRPVVSVSEKAQAIDPRRLELRLPTQNIPREILPLIETINLALARLESGFRVQRDFTADAAHELRTPLSVLRMRIDRLEDQDIAKPLRANIGAMAHIVDQLLDVAELEGMIVGPGDKADIHAVCSEVASLMAPVVLAQRKDVALTGSGNPVWVRGNAAMLFQAVRNLVENAARYAPEGTAVEIAIDEQGLVRVQDEGPGVPEAVQELIFRRFWRQDRSKSGGAGLGLSIVSRVAEAHAGTIRVENRGGGGSIFTLDLRASRILSEME